MAAAKGNPFAALAQGDSDSESDVQPVIIVKQQPTAPNTPAAPVAKEPASPPFRTWGILKEQDKTHAIFRQNHFSSKDKDKKRRGKMIHAEADHEGWVSIKKNQPMFVDESAGSSDTEQEIKKEALLDALPSLDDSVSAAPVTQDEGATGMRSLLSRGQNEMTALDWAERVRASLERAEQTRRPAGTSQPADTFVSSLGRLSFFRRTLPSENVAS